MTAADDTGHWVVLTDDELAGVAGHAGVVWPSPLPSLDPTDGKGLLAAARRGLRSLRVRQEAEPSLAVDLLCATLAPALTGRSRLAAFAHRVGATEPLGQVTMMYPVDRVAILSEGVAPSGIHTFVRSVNGESLAAIAAACGGVLAPAQQRAGGHETSQLAISVRAATPSSVQILTAEPGRFQLTTLGAEGPTSSGADPNALSAALEGLFASMRS